MAKNKNKNKENEVKKDEGKEKKRWRFTDLVAFCALSAAALLLLVGPLLGWLLRNTGGQSVLRALNLIAQYSLLLAIALPAWYFVRGKKKGWKVFYFIMLAIYIAGTVLGVTLGI